MELNTINTKTNRVWSTIADKLDKNFDRINTAVTAIESETSRNKGYFSSEEELKSMHPLASEGDIAYVGTDVFDIWKWNGKSWENTYITGGEGNVNLGNYYTRADVDMITDHALYGSITDKPSSILD